MVQVSDDLVWMLTKKNNSFVRYSNKRNGAKLSADPFNVTGELNRSASGLANSKAVGVSHNGKQCVLSLKTSTAGSKPKKAGRKVILNTHGRGTKACFATVRKLTEGSHYRADSTRAAGAKITLLAKAERKALAGVSYKPKSRSNK